MLPTVVTINGPQPQNFSDLRDQLINGVAAINPGFTADLPGSLVEDLSSTATGAIALCDKARVDTIQSLTPYGANQYVLNQLGVQAGIQPGLGTRTSVFVQVTATPGFRMDRGYVFGDGANQYVLQDPVVVPASGVTNQLFCVATVDGPFAVPRNTVTQVLTRIPTGITVTCTNPNDGIPATQAESVETYRARVLEAESAIATGMTKTLRTALGQLPGVQSNRISVVQQPAGGWAVLVGGGDPYAVANAIFSSMFDISLLKGSALTVSNITAATNGVATFNLNHGLVPGSTFTVTGTNTPYDATYVVDTVTSPKVLTVTQNTSTFGAFPGHALLNPNPRDEVVTVLDSPDTYDVKYVLSPSQDVTVNVTWDSDAPNLIDDDAVSVAISPVVVSYINGLTTGKPINTFSLDAKVQAAVSSIIPVEYLSRLVYGVTIDGVVATPAIGTGLIYGDPESYFVTDNTQVVVVRG
ncbi:hypothetical protein [Paraburkholderia caribensis]|uniref:hypothetical protein n=1 Tax=Paraburkholderia caribensis TaxID=75105 RepID=UPI002091BB6D|nr:hypothetical protein [Paraburkholderia caribensis]MCO4880230.1 hypothetical protein [Paraburkholderia caribensis]